MTAAASICCFFDAPAIAAPVVPNTGDVLRSIEQRPSSDELPQKAPEPLQIPKPSQPEQTGQQIKIFVKTIMVTGNTLATDAEIRQAIKPYENRELTLTEAQQAAGSLSRVYWEKGFPLVIAYLPPQEISNGILRIDVLEGKIDEVTVNEQGGVRLSRERIIDVVRNGAPKGETLKVNKLERSLLLLNTYPGIHAQSSLAPGSIPGTSNLQVDVTQERMLAGNIQADNYGIKTTGENRFGGGLQLIDPMGIGDYLNLQGMTTEHNGINTGSIDYSLPIGHLGTRIFGGVSYLEYELGEQLADLDGFGRATIYSLGMHHPLIMQRQHDLSIIGTYAHKKLVDDLDAVDSNSHRRIDLFTFGLSYRLFDDFRGSNHVYLQYGQGHLGMQSEIERTIDGLPGGLGRAGYFSKLNAGLVRLQGLTNELSLLFSLSGQYAFQNLDSVEKMSIGGPFSVRAYPSSESSGDDGWLTSVELQWQASQWLALSTFWDTGWVRFDHEKSELNPFPNDRSLTAYGVAARLGKSKGPQMTASVAWPNSSDSVSDPDQSEPRLFVSLGYQF